jgi:hypothetical protein
MPSSKLPASEKWLNESSIVGDEEVLYQERFTDPETGVRPISLTHRPFDNTHIYPESPVSFPNGRRFIFARLHPPCGYRTFHIADLDTLRIRQITDEPDASFPMVTPDGSAMYYYAGGSVWRMCPTTFKRKDVFRIPEHIGKLNRFSSISYCGTRLLGMVQNGQSREIAVVNLKNQSAHIAFTHPDCCGHEQYCRGESYRILIQVNDGIEYDHEGNLIRLIGENGASIHTCNDDGSDIHILPMGQSPVERVQGHECWLGQEERVISTTHRRESKEHPWRQNLIVASGPGDDAYEIICEGDDENFTHMHTTLDGRFWISDCNRTAKIYIGSIQTGRFKRFCDSGSSFGAHQTTHPHPFFISDRTVGWNSDVTGVSQIYIADIPDGFLDSLED